MSNRTKKYTRRDVLKYGGAAGAGALIARSVLAQVCETHQPVPIDEIAFTSCGFDGETMPTSPFILQPFNEPLPVPKTLRPGWRHSDGTLIPADDGAAWLVRKSAFGSNVRVLPGPEAGRQDALGDRPGVHAGQVNPETGRFLTIPNAGTHQLWPGNGVRGGGRGFAYDGLSAAEQAAIDQLPDPLLFHVRLQVRAKKFTLSPVVNIDANGNVVPLPGGIPTDLVSSAGLATLPIGFRQAGQRFPAYLTPASTIYGFNGAFPGPLINVDYGRPIIVRFENDLDLNPLCRDRQDFGAPDWAFLTHLHNGHTAPESDGQPHHLGETHDGGYQPEEWSDNLYLQYPAGNDDNEKQSFLWFHDHRMHHTGPNVYKGMVGLMPHYDPVSVNGGPGLDPGDEKKGLRLPGVRTDHGDGTFDVEYDIPMAFYDCVLDDGVTQHNDEHTPLATTPDSRLPGIVCGATHPEWWGQLFHNHFVNHGFVGDIFTINGTAFPTLNVKRRKYRFRFLDASLARQYRFSIRSGTPFPFPGQQGQWNFGQQRGNEVVRDSGRVALQMRQIASEGGLLPYAIQRQEVEIWPAKRREVIVDFSLLRSGAVVYLCNTLQMVNGRKETVKGEPGFRQNYCVPMLKIVVDGVAPDDSLMPNANVDLLRPAPEFTATLAPTRFFSLERGGSAGGETEWLINGLEFNPLVPQAFPLRGAEENWAINNGGGGWTHPMHLHQEEHHVVFRSTALEKHLDDVGKEDVVALEPSEQTNIVRKFRTYFGNYVAHCHNLAHEDHNMMFGWTITKE